MKKGLIGRKEVEVIFSEFFYFHSKSELRKKKVDCLNSMWYETSIIFPTPDMSLQKKTCTFVYQLLGKNHIFMLSLYLCEYRKYESSFTVCLHAAILLTTLKFDYISKGLLKVTFSKCQVYMSESTKLYSSKLKANIENLAFCF